MSILEQLQEKHDFTDTEMLIADYLLQNKDSVSTMTITRLAGSTYSSNASVIRLYKKLGLCSFRDLRLQIVKESERLRKASRDVDMDFPFHEKDSIDDITRSMSDLLTETAELMKSLPLNSELKRAADMIKNANTFYYEASGDTLLTLRAFANRLMKLSIHAIYVDENREFDARIQRMRPGNVLLCASYSGKSLPSETQLSRLRRRQVKTLLITSRKDISGYDLVIRFPDKEHLYDEKIATFYSQTAIAYLLNCIFAILYQHR